MLHFEIYLTKGFQIETHLLTGKRVSLVWAKAVILALYLSKCMQMTAKVWSMIMNATKVIGAVQAKADMRNWLST